MKLLKGKGCLTHVAMLLVEGMPPVITDVVVAPVIVWGLHATITDERMEHPAMKHRSSN
jgi:hypothetical protein